MTQTAHARLIAVLSKRSPEKRVDDFRLFACCFHLSSMATPEMTEAVPTLMAIVNDEAFSDSTRIAALAVLSKIGGQEVRTAMVTAVPLLPRAKGSEELRKAVFDVSAGRLVQLKSIEEMIKALDIPLVNIKLTLLKLKALAKLSYTANLRTHLLDQADGLEALAKEIRQGL